MKCVLVFSLVLLSQFPPMLTKNRLPMKWPPLPINLIASFTPDQKSASVFAIDHDHRLDWHFIPKERKGTSLKEMTPQQRHLTTALLAASLSVKGSREDKQHYEP